MFTKSSLETDFAHWCQVVIHVCSCGTIHVECVWDQQSQRKSVYGEVENRVKWECLKARLHVFKQFKKLCACDNY